MNNEANSSMLQKSLPSSAYLSEEIFAREKENIFFHEWICAGREEQIPNPGDYLVLDILGESVLVVRTKEGKLKAHYNVCRHRGARLCLTPSQSEDVKLNGSIGLAGIRCPYHLWTYSLDGTLLGAPHLREGD
jgi:Rieske 2Fe-2S family protein